MRARVRARVRVRVSVACRAAAPSRTHDAPQRSYPRAGSLGPGPRAPVPSWGSHPPSLVAAATAASRSVGCSEARLGGPPPWPSAAPGLAHQSRACPNRRDPWTRTEPTPLRVSPAANVRRVHASRRLGEAVAGGSCGGGRAWNPRATMPRLNSFLEILPSLLVSHCEAEHSLKRGAADEQAVISRRRGLTFRKRSITRVMFLARSITSSIEASEASALSRHSSGSSK